VVLAAAGSLLVPARAASGRAVTAGMLPAREFGFFRRVRAMTLCRLGMKRARFVLVFLVMLRGFAVMTRGVFMMIRGAVMMLTGRMLMGHLISPDV
jgi:hypothetical protein